MIPKTPLEDWIAAKISVPAPLTRELLQEYQLKKIRQTLALVKSKSAFYRRQLRGIDPERITDFESFAKLPFTTHLDLRHNSRLFVCSGLAEIERIVTLQSSGTTGRPKRIYFTRVDQELTIDFFDYGMRSLVTAADRVMILLPCRPQGSVGDLLQKGLRRLQAVPLPYGPVFDVQDAIAFAVRNGATALVGIPTHVLAMARRPGGEALRGQIKNVLLSTDHVPQAICRVLEEKWDCRVFNHYGMTEMGLGGGVQCAALRGYHLREADLYVEIIDPETGEPLPDGQSGEIVFTTLTRTGMPLIRYRTGDLSRFLTDKCPCGTVLRSLELVKNRIGEAVRIENETFSLADLDEKLFALEGVLDFLAEIRETKTGKELHIGIKSLETSCLSTNSVLEALLAVPALKKIYPEKIKILVSINEQEITTSRGTAKRIIVRQGGQPSA